MDGENLSEMDSERYDRKKPGFTSATLLGCRGPSADYWLDVNPSRRSRWKEAVGSYLSGRYIYVL